jgi:integrase
MLLSGQRPGELSHMRREHIVDGWWEMPGDSVPALGWPGTKNGASHRVWLPKAAQALIADLTDDGVTSGFVFAGQSGRPLGGLDAAMRRSAQSSVWRGQRLTTFAEPTAPPSRRSASVAMR